MFLQVDRVDRFSDPPAVFLRGLLCLIVARLIILLPIRSSRPVIHFHNHHSSRMFMSVIQSFEPFKSRPPSPWLFVLLEAVRRLSCLPTWFYLRFFPPSLPLLAKYALLLVRLWFIYHSFIHSTRHWAVENCCFMHRLRGRFYMKGNIQPLQNHQKAPCLLSLRFINHSGPKLPITKLTALIDMSFVRVATDRWSTQNCYHFSRYC